MSADNPFLEAIHDRPDDDLPRLVYADWLEERGETEQAEFVRLECQVYRLRKFDADFMKQQSRLQQVWSQIDPAWTARIGIRRLLYAQVRRPYFTVSEAIEVTAVPRLPTRPAPPLTLRVCPFPQTDKVVFEDRCWKRTWVSETGNGVIQGIKDFLGEYWAGMGSLGSLRIIWTGQRADHLSLSFTLIRAATTRALIESLPPHRLVRLE